VPIGSSVRVTATYSPIVTSFGSTSVRPLAIADVDEYLRHVQEVDADSGVDGALACLQRVRAVRHGSGSRPRNDSKWRAPDEKYLANMYRKALSSCAARHTSMTACRSPAAASSSLVKKRTELMRSIVSAAFGTRRRAERSSAIDGVRRAPRRTECAIRLFGRAAPIGSSVRVLRQRSNQRRIASSVGLWKPTV
jgi:hypothetical protein